MITVDVWGERRGGEMGEARRGEMMGLEIIAKHNNISCKSSTHLIQHIIKCSLPQTLMRLWLVDP